MVALELAALEELSVTLLLVSCAAEAWGAKINSGPRLNTNVTSQIILLFVCFTLLALNYPKLYHRNFITVALIHSFFVT